MVFDTNKVEQAAKLGIRGGNNIEYSIAGIIDLNSIPDNKKHLEIGSDENPMVAGQKPGQRPTEHPNGMKFGHHMERAPYPNGSYLRYFRIGSCLRPGDESSGHNIGRA